MGTAEITRKRATEKRAEQKDGDIFEKGRRETVGDWVRRENKTFK